MWWCEIKRLAVRYGKIFIFCSHYYRSKANRQGLSQGGGSSSQIIWPGAPWCRVAPPLCFTQSQNTVYWIFCVAVSVMCSSLTQDLRETSSLYATVGPASFFLSDDNKNQTVSPTLILTLMSTLKWREQKVTVLLDRK